MIITLSEKKQSNYMTTLQEVTRHGVITDYLLMLMILVGHLHKYTKSNKHDLSNIEITKHLSACYAVDCWLRVTIRFTIY